MIRRLEFLATWDPSGVEGREVRPQSIFRWMPICRAWQLGLYPGDFRVVNGTRHGELFV